MGNRPPSEPSDWIETAPEFVRWFAAPTGGAAIGDDEKLAAAFAVVGEALDLWRTEYRATKAMLERTKNSPEHMAWLHRQVADLNRRLATARSEGSG